VVFNFSLEEELNRQTGLLGILLISLPDYALADPVLQICNKLVFLGILYAGVLFMFVIIYVECIKLMQI
jgi:hypothetical protein